MSGRAAAAAIYPRNLCKAVCRGTVLQAQHDSADIMSLKCSQDISSIDNVEHDPEDWLKYWDDMSGRQLDKQRTIQARKDEIIRINSMKVWKKVPLTQCWANTGRKPVGTRWVHVDKGDGKMPKPRSRLIAQ